MSKDAPQPPVTEKLPDRPEVLPAGYQNDNPLAPGGVERRRRRVPRRVFATLRLLTFGLLAVAGLWIVLVMFKVMRDPQTTGPVILTLISANVLLILVFMLYIGRHLILLFLERRGRLRKSRLPFRFLGIFTILAMLPPLMVAGYALFMLNQGLETWFSDKVSRALEGSLQVAQAYLDEHEKALQLEAQALAQHPVLQEEQIFPDPYAIRKFLRAAQEIRGLEEVSLYDNAGNLLNTATPALTTPEALIMTMMGTEERRPRAFTDFNGGQVMVMVPVSSHSWLLVSRAIHPSVVARMDQTEEAFKEYYGLLKEREKLRLLFTVMTLTFAIGALAGAIWAGLRLAGRIVRPVTELVHATNKVSAGDLDVRLSPHDDDEMGILTQSFNRMTQQLKNNRTLVEKKNKELDARRRTMEAVLTGVSSGVVALAKDGVVTTVNKTARDVLGVRVGQRIDKAMPELAPLLDEFLEQPQDFWQRQVRLEREDKMLTMLVRLVPQRVGGGELSGVVATFDDITPLLSAQKVAAWSDVARRLAHEIKNPLTPIQLSAERLRRKYLQKVSAEDQALFKELTETIVRQTEDMRGMLNEFSDFARMPMPTFERQNLLEIVDEVMTFEKNARLNITFEQDIQGEKEAFSFVCDRGQVKRVLTNVVENSVNAIQERPKAENMDKGEIKVVVKLSQSDKLSLSVLDNGRGLPEDVEVDTLFDPYITTRKKGTGLGLAIVRRVMDEHGGQVAMKRRPEGGTEVELTFPAKLSEVEVASAKAGTDND